MPGASFDFVRPIHDGFRTCWVEPHFGTLLNTLFCAANGAEPYLEMIWRWGLPVERGPIINFYDL